MFNPYRPTKFEVSTTTCSDDVKGNANCKNSRFEPPSGGLTGNVHGSSMARWKARGGLSISANWTFVASYHGWGTVSAYWSKSLSTKGRWVTFSANFRRTGVQVADLSHEKFKSSRVMRWWLIRLSSRFGAKSSRERKPKWLPGLLTCHMGSHSVTYHPTEVRIPPLPPAKAGTWFSDPGRMQGWVDLCYIKVDHNITT